MAGCYDSEYEGAHDQLLPPHQIFPVLDLKEIGEDSILIIKVGNLHGMHKDFHESPIIRDSILKGFHSSLIDCEDSFWVTFEDFVTMFDNVDICRVGDDWDEFRLRGRFTRSQYISKDDNYVSKSMYAIEVHQKSHLIIGLHQDDIKQDTSFGSYLDFGLALLKLDKVQGTSLVQYLPPSE